MSVWFCKNSDGEKATCDHFMKKDPRIIPNLLNLENKLPPVGDYFQHVQRFVKPYMRKIVTNWMLEVCDEQRCEGQVFPLAVCFMDHFLSSSPILSEQLQLLGVCCLLLASKIRQCYPFTIELLCAYTDNGVNCDQVRMWELLVLSRLQWSLCRVTAFDYIDHILERVPWGFENLHIRQHSHTLVSVCYTEMLGMLCQASVLASACICAATRGLKSPSSHLTLRDVCRLTGSDPLEVELTIRNIEAIVSNETAIQKEHRSVMQQQQQQQCSINIKVGVEYDYIMQTESKALEAQNIAL